jgi:thiol-disulfide isomerase/thioredoxin
MLFLCLNIQTQNDGCLYYELVKPNKRSTYAAMKRTINLSIFCLLIAQSFSLKAQVVFEDLTFTEAIAKANKEYKFVFLDFRADWCKPCIEMEQTTFQDTTVGNYLTDKAISLKVDVDLFSGMDIKEMYNVNQYPTMLILDPYDSSVQLRMIGFKPANILLGDLKFVMDEIVVYEEEDNPQPTEQTPKKVKKKCFFNKWLDKLTE